MKVGGSAAYSEDTGFDRELGADAVLGVDVEGFFEVFAVERQGTLWPSLGGAW